MGAEFGRAVAASGHWVAVGAPYAAGASGLVAVTNTQTGSVTTLYSPDYPSQQVFGYSVALAGGILAVGAPSAYNGAGMVFVYQYLSGGWQEIAQFGSPDAQPYLYVNYTVLQTPGDFGTSVGISGNTLVVGAPGENSTGVVDAGRVYIINLQNDFIKTISSPAPQRDGAFGYSVAISGNRIVVGDLYANGAGAAYLYAASTGDYIETFSSLNPSLVGFEDLPGTFGLSVAINGTYVAVGAPYETAGGVLGAGHAYVFNLLNGSEIALNATVPNTPGLFGLSVAINAGTVLVGAPLANVTGQQRETGAAFLFSTVSGAQISSEFVSSDSSIGGEAGFAVAETSSQFVVGAPLENASGDAQAGHAYLFNQVPLTFSSPHELFGTPGAFGQSIAVNQTVVIGAPREFADFADDAGHAYVLSSHTGPFLTLTSPAAQFDGEFGASVGVAGNRVAVGAPGQGNLSAVSIGNAYLFTPQGALVATLDSPQPQAGGLFGYSIAIAGNVVVVGSPGENVTGEPFEGAAYVFSASTGTLLWTLQSPNPQFDGLFGLSVAVAGGKIVVGAPGEGDFNGFAYVFSAATGALLFALSDPAPGGAGAVFGFSVAIGGSTVAVGAPDQTVGGMFEAGEAFSFSSSSGALKAETVSPNSIGGGIFGAVVADNGGTIVVSAPDETAFGVGDAGNIYLVNPSNGAILDRYNSPNPVTNEAFGTAVAIGPAGVIGVGAPALGTGAAYLFFL